MRVVFYAMRPTLCQLSYFDPGGVVQRLCTSCSPPQPGIHIICTVIWYIQIVRESNSKRSYFVCCSLQPSSEEPSIQPSSEEPSIQPSSEEPSVQPSSEEPSLQPSLLPWQPYLDFEWSCCAWILYGGGGGAGRRRTSSRPPEKSLEST